MAACDLCSAETYGPRRVAGPLFQAAVARGLRPRGPAAALGEMFGVTDAWVATALADPTAWALCPDCEAEYERFSGVGHGEDPTSEVTDGALTGSDDTEPSVASPVLVAAGWYHDPEQPGQERYWDGAGWTDRHLPTPPSAPPQAPQPLPAAGWYHDPEQPGQERYWDGNGWTDQRVPTPPPSQEGTQEPRAEHP